MASSAASSLSYKANPGDLPMLDSRLNGMGAMSMCSEALDPGEGHEGQAGAALPLAEVYDGKGQRFALALDS